MKKHWLIYLVVVILAGIGGFVIYQLKPFSAEAKQKIFSPLPYFLTMFKNNQVSTLSLWLPKTDKIKGSSIKKPDISAKSAVVYDLTTNKILYFLNEKEKLPMASLTKVMTAIIALENPKKNDRYFVRKQSLVGEDSMGLTEGEVLTLEDLLYGLMLNSGNDAAEVLADNYTKGRQKFIEAMNNKAKSMGLKNTNFTNPSGLEGDGNQYTTAEDLLIITKYALSNFSAFAKVVSTFEYSIPYTNTHKAFYLYNETNLLTSYPGVKGVKTGYTPEAGLCLITYLEHEGHKIIGILLGSNNRRQEMRELLDYSLKILGEVPPPHK